MITRCQALMLIGGALFACSFASMMDAGIMDYPSDKPLDLADLDYLFNFYDHHSQYLIRNKTAILSHYYSDEIGVMAVNIETAGPQILKDTFGFNAEAGLPQVVLRLRNGDIVRNFKPLRMDSEIEIETFLADNGIVNKMVAHHVAHVKADNDAVAASVNVLIKVKKPETQHVKQLCTKTFPAGIKATKLNIVLFYLPWEPNSVGFIYTFGAVAEHFAADKDVSFSSLECYQWTDVCHKQSIFTYPVIRVFRADQPAVDYHGILDHQSLVKAITLFKLQSPIELESEAQVHELIDNKLTTVPAAEVVVFGLFKNSYDKGIEIFNGAANMLYGEQLVVSAHGDAASKAMSKFGCGESSCVVVLRRNDKLTPFVTKPVGDCPKALTKTIRAHANPTLSELNHLTFPGLYMRGQPLAILLRKKDAEGDDKAFKNFEKAAASDSSHVFAWAEVSDEVGNIGKQLVQYYFNGPALPALVVIDLKKGVYYHICNGKKSLSDNENFITEWLAKAKSGVSRPDGHLSNKPWKPAREFEHVQMDKEAFYQHPEIMYQTTKL